MYFYFINDNYEVLDALLLWNSWSYINVVIPAAVSCFAERTILPGASTSRKKAEFSFNAQHMSNCCCINNGLHSTLLLIMCVCGGRAACDACFYMCVFMHLCDACVYLPECVCVLCFMCVFSPPGLSPTSPRPPPPPTHTHTHLKPMALNHWQPCW